jgi:hypothetical protein
VRSPENNGRRANVYFLEHNENEGGALLEHVRCQEERPFIGLVLGHIPGVDKEIKRDCLSEIRGILELRAVDPGLAGAGIAVDRENWRQSYRRLKWRDFAADMKKKGLIGRAKRVVANHGNARTE